MKHKGFIGIFSVLAAGIFAVNAAAFDSPRILEYYSENDMISVYANDVGTGDISCRIAGYECEAEIKENIYSDAQMYKTLFIIDSSKSMQPFAKQIEEFLLECIDKKRNNEYFSFAVFGGKSINVITSFDTNQYTLEKAVANITYNAESSYIFDNVDNAVKDLYNDSDHCYERIVLFTDGCENSAKGITIDDLEKTVAANPIQIYTVTFVNSDKSNYEKLKTAARMARVSNGADIQISATSNISQSAKILFDDAASISKIDIRVDSAVADGSRKAIEIISDGTSVKSEIIVPMLSAEKQTEPETETAPPVYEEPKTETTAAAPDVPDKKKNNAVPIIIAAAVILAAVIVIIAVVLKSKKTQKTSSAPVNDKPPADNDDTQFINSGGDTEHFFDDDTSLTEPVQIILRDPISSRTFEASLTGTIVVGRSSDESSLVVDYDKSISKRHCKIYRNGRKVYIEDLGSSNKTYVNDILITSAHILSNGDEIKLGRVKFRVSIS